MTRDEFLEKYLTVVDKDRAIREKDEAFIDKYLTQVGCPTVETYRVSCSCSDAACASTITTDKSAYEEGETVEVIINLVEGETWREDPPYKVAVGEQEVEVDYETNTFVMPAGDTALTYRGTDHQEVPVYALTLTNSGTGPTLSTVTADKSEYEEGEEVILHVNLAEGEHWTDPMRAEPDTVVITDDSFIMPASPVTIKYYPAKD